MPNSPTCMIRRRVGGNTGRTIQCIVAYSDTGPHFEGAYKVTCLSRYHDTYSPYTVPTSVLDSLASLHLHGKRSYDCIVAPKQFCRLRVPTSLRVTADHNQPLTHYSRAVVAQLTTFELSTPPCYKKSIVCKDVQCVRRTDS